MPPKKKNRLPSLTVGEENVEEIVAKEPTSPSNEPADQWTDEQEASLFRSMISWKPVGSFLSMEEPWGSL